MELSNIIETEIYIKSIDFSPIIQRLIKFKKWKQRRAEKAAKAYKQFLLLQKKYGKQYKLVPSKEIDEVWHEHILFTKQYIEDCQCIFGEYFHHQPETNIGKHILTETQIEARAQETEKLYLQEYGEYIYGEPVNLTIFIEKLIIFFKISKLIKQIPFNKY